MLIAGLVLVAVAALFLVYRLVRFVLWLSSLVSAAFAVLGAVMWLQRQLTSRAQPPGARRSSG
jgi:hypothetical protein